MKYNFTLLKPATKCSFVLLGTDKPEAYPTTTGTDKPEACPTINKKPPPGVWPEGGLVIMGIRTGQGGQWPAADPESGPINYGASTAIRVKPVRPLPSVWETRP